MSYLVLARKWRPKTFADTVGQQHVLQALINALNTGRLHHAYLFAGTRGVGKTTIARILAKALNCEGGVTAEPCGECSACCEIDEGRFVDLIEVDAASKTKVDDTRELLDNVQYAPARGRFKVYLIDEVHMLSKSSFNALLKTLEEPPPHVKFLLATTDPQNLPVTVLSRCLQFNLSRLTPRLISDRLTHICKEENITADEQSLAELARAADGSLRDALSLLDQAIAYCGGDVAFEQVAAMLGTIDRSYVYRLLELLADNDGGGVLEVVASMDEYFPDYGRLLEDMASVLQRVAILQTIGNGGGDEELDGERLSALAEQLLPADTQLFYQIALTGRRDLALAPDPRGGVEMTLLRMLAFRPAANSAASGSSGAKKSLPKSAPRTVQPVGGAPRPDHSEVRAKEWADPDWNALLPELGLKGAVRMLALNCAFLRRGGDTLYFEADGSAESMLTRARVDALSTALSQHYSETLKVDVQVARDREGVETPVEQASRETSERYEAARRSLESDPNVQSLKDMFGAELKTETIEPIKPAGAE